MIGFFVVNAVLFVFGATDIDKMNPFVDRDVQAGFPTYLILGELTTRFVIMVLSIMWLVADTTLNRVLIKRGLLFLFLYTTIADMFWCYYIAVSKHKLKNQKAKEAATSTVLGFAILQVSIFALLQFYFWRVACQYDKIKSENEQSDVREPLKVDEED